MTEHELLTALARRKGRERPLAGPVEWDSDASLPARSPDWGLDALWERFARELERLGGTPYRAASLADARAHVARVAAGAAGLPAAQAAGGDRPIVMAWNDPVVASLGLDGALREVGLDLAVWGGNAAAGPRQARELAARAVAGITGVDWAVAETGTLLLCSAPGRGRVVSLLPPVHVALIRPAQLLPSLAEAIRRVGRATELPSSLVLITGPSRSADIENDLSIGVHGPGSVHAVLLPE